MTTCDGGFLLSNTQLKILRVVQIQWEINDSLSHFQRCWRVAVASPSKWPMSFVPCYVTRQNTRFLIWRIIIRIRILNTISHQRHSSDTEYEQWNGVEGKWRDCVKVWETDWEVRETKRKNRGFRGDKKRRSRRAGHSNIVLSENTVDF